MTTETTPTTGSATPVDTESRTRTLRMVTAAGGLATVVGTFLAWTYTDEFPGDLTVYGYPGGLQILSLIAGALVVLFALASLGVKGLGWLIPAGSTRALRMLALGGGGGARGAPRGARPGRSL
ncbi:hypothetical protein ACFW15_03390, partial [Streptomyces sp. NPDC058953]